MRLAIVHKEKCNHVKCNSLCARLCPVNRKDQDCIKINEKASISEELCIGCGICQNRCPFDAIRIINLPDILSRKVIYRYGKNGFSLYSLPSPRFDAVLGLLGKNGIGKTTAIELLSAKLQPNFATETAADEKEIKSFFQGTELFNYFEKLPKLKISVKPQQLAELAVPVKVSELLAKFSSQEEIEKLTRKFDISSLLDRQLDQLSGGELQKVAIVTAALKQADVYFFDEPLAYLDVSERIKASDFISSLLSKEKSVVVIEHDLLLFDYMTDYVNIFYGQPSCYGIVADIRTAKRAINTYLQGFLQEENVRFRDKAIIFDFSARKIEKTVPLVEWPAFSKSYDGFTLNASEGSISIRSITGITGRNAIGKTTFVKCLAGLLETEPKLKLKLKISYKPQYLESESTATVVETVKKEKIDKRLISLLGLENLMFRQLNQLSGGELQRVAIASCLAREADLYLLDEPSAYLDVEERLQAARAIKEIISEKDHAAFVVDHDLLFLSYLADSIIVFSGTPGKNATTSSTMDFVSGINELLKQLDITVRRDVESGRPKINKKGSVLDREQREKGQYFAI